jgi:tetratricopeptide (TPR) repeat protein
MRLSRLSGLRVMARSSVFRYKGPDVDPIAAGRALGVAAVVTGRLLHRGDHLVVNVELVDLADESQLWGERYSRRMSDALAIENEVATQISETLRLKLTGEEKQTLARKATESTEAYRLFLQGRFSWHKRTESGIRRSIELFRRALELDPAYAGAYAALADSYAVLGFYTIVPPGDAFPKAKAAARRALAIDSHLAEARAPLAYATHYYDWNYDEAEAEYLRALDERPNYAVTPVFYANLLTLRGRFEEALAQIEAGCRLDPLSLIAQASRGWVYYHARRFEDAVRNETDVLDMDPTFVVGLRIRGLALAKLGRVEEALVDLKRAAEISDATLFASDVALGLAGAGRPEEARRLLQDLESASDRRYVGPYGLAAAHLALGDPERALAGLEEALSQRSHWLTLLELDPRFDALRDDPRLKAISDRVIPQ